MDSNDNKNAIHLEEGFQKLDGEEALALARTRKIDNDIERGKRQQLVLKRLLIKLFHWVLLRNMEMSWNLWEVTYRPIWNSMKC